jgi:hypothetical protein
MFLPDLRHGLRLLRRAPQLNAAVSLTLAHGIGVHSVVFSIFNGLLFQANVSQDPASFVRIYAQRAGRARPEAPGAIYDGDARRMGCHLKTKQNSFRDHGFEWATFTVTNGVAANLRGLSVSCNFLSATPNRRAS